MKNHLHKSLKRKKSCLGIDCLKHKIKVISNISFPIGSMEKGVNLY